MTWNVTLPVDGSPTHNQSDLYSAIWFGMTLTDPWAWMNVCELELQFYPDSGWYAPGPLDPNSTVNGLWVAQAVAWQIDALTGAEDPCFISPLFTNGVFGPNVFNMSQGDRIQVTMTGWVGDPNGENIAVQDLTNGNSSTVNLYNHTGNYGSYFQPWNNYTLGKPNYPLDPSYVANDMENALPWTPGGEFPVSWAFEIGHGGNPTVPNTNPYGGCSPGVPPNSPDSPCPSYDPGSWTVDTASPWQIAPPVFFNATSRAVATQVGIHQDTGGPGFIDNATGNAVTTACIGNAPSAWCDYPWWSYACADKAFNFGATDYAQTSDDFGQDAQYSLSSVVNSAGLRYYAPQNFSVPSCGAPSYTVQVGATGNGAAYFLNQSLTTGTSFPNLLPGNYSLHAVANTGAVFTGWATTGSVAVGNAKDPYTWVDATGGGTATATFAATGGTTSVTFQSNPSTGSIEIVPGYRIGTTLGTNQGSGSSLTLRSGEYSVTAVPPTGYNFSRWSVSSGGAYVTAPALPYTMLVVTAGGPAVTLTADYQATVLKDYLQVEVVTGLGTVTLQGQGPTTFAQYFVPLGGYRITATPATGWSFAGWGYTEFVTMGDLLNPNGHFLVETLTNVYAVAVGAFFDPAVTFDDSPVAGGGVALASQGFLPAPSGTTFYLAPGTYTIVAAPHGGYSFTSWSVSSSTAVWVQQPLSAVSLLTVNFTGSVTAHFGAPGVTDVVWLNDTPALGGRILFNYEFYSSGQSNGSVSGGLYAAFAIPAPGYRFSSWAVSGDLTRTTTNNVFSLAPFLGHGALLATFVPVAVPVTYVGPVGATISTFSVAPDTSALLDPGTYVLSATLATNSTFLYWTTQGGVQLGSTTSSSTTVNVSGPGVVWAYETFATFSVSPISLVPGANVSEFAAFHASVSVLSGSGPFRYAWVAPAGWCPSLAVATLTCTPTSTGTFTLSVTVTDAIGHTLSPAPVHVKVLVPLSITGIFVSYRAVTLGTTLQVSASTLGGESPYSISFAGLPGCVAANTAGVETCTPTTVGSFVLNVTASDAAGQVAYRTTGVVVNPALTAPSFTASPSPVTQGVVVNLTLTVQGGTAPYTEAYSGLPSGVGCVSQNFTQLSCLPSGYGSFTVMAHVTDQGGGSTSASVTLVVNVAPSVESFSASPNAVTVGGSVTLTVAATGGTAPLSYSYAGLPSDCAGRNAATLVCASKVPGLYTVTVTVTDADGKIATQAASFTVSPAGSGPSTAGGFTTLDGVLIAVVVAAAVLGAVLLLRRRGSRGTETRPTTPPAPPAGAVDGSEAPPPAPDPNESYTYGEPPGGS